MRKEAMKKYPSFLHRLFSCMERRQHKNTDTNPCQTVLRASREALIQSLSAFILEILCNARNGMTRIANYLRNPMTKQYIKFLIKADSVNEAVLPRRPGMRAHAARDGIRVFGVVILFYESAESVPTSLGPGTWGREIGSLYTGIHGFLSVKAAFRPEYSRYT